MGAHVISRFTTSTCTAPPKSLLYREMIPPNEGMHVPDQFLIPRTYRAGLPYVAGPLLQQHYRDEHMLLHVHKYVYIYMIYIYTHTYTYTRIYIYIYVSINM